MNRQEKYPDTEYFHYYNANPKNKITCDCVVRAISVGMSQSWEKTLKDLIKLSIETGYEYTDDKCYGKYLISNGWKKMKEPRNEFNKKMSVIEYIDANLSSDNGNGIDTYIIANVGSHHVVAISSGVVHDIWNSSHQTMHSFWVKI